MRGQATYNGPARHNNPAVTLEFEHRSRESSRIRVRMPVRARILGTCETRLWGLDARTRIARQLAALDISVDDDGDRGREDAPVLLIDAHYLFEHKTLAALLEHSNTALVCPRDGRIAAAFVQHRHEQAVRDHIDDPKQALPGDIGRINPDALESYDDHLRRGEPPLLERIRVEKQQDLEALLYGNAYKGITDFVTKWWWPRPARVLVRICAGLGISANAVTLTGVALMLLSCALFHHGFFAAGLLSGWVMTLLDTVDGKLARVTVTSSRLGHVLDHGMDILHPPVWYALWAYGLENGYICGYGVDELVALTVAAYVGGRVLEGAFHGLGSCSTFAWRPFDAYFRLVTARRNPCLVLLTAATLCGRPDIGLFAVAAWSALSTLVIAARLVQAVVVRLGGPPLTSWLSAADAAERYPRAYRTFSGTRGAYG